ncbi:MAG: amidohydrolase [Chloroflexi bacterium]|nr:amidohydrolase [Chloroflexota bacterium]
MNQEPVDLLIHGGLILTMDAERRHLRGDLAIRGDRIVALGAHLDIPAGRVIDARHRAVLPGLINAHTHETLTRGLAEDLPLNRWLAEICFPLDSSYTPDIMRAAAMMNQLEMIRGGITCFVDMYRYPSACAEVAEVSGLRAILAPQIIVDPPGVGESLEEAEAFVAAWKGRSPRILPAIGPHAPYSCPAETYRRAAQIAAAYDVPIHTHLAETRWEVDTLLARHGVTPAEYLDQLSILGPRLSVAHGVHLTSKEIGLLAERGVSVIYNPTSNMKLASGVAPVLELRAAGVTVGLGTDSNLSNNNLDMFEEMRLGAILQKLHRGDAAALPCEDVLAMATIEGARALGVAEKIGSLEPGKQADVILVDLDQPHLWPLVSGEHENTVEQLVYSASAADVTHTLVAGQLLMADRQVLTLDRGEVREKVVEATRELLARAGFERSHPAVEWKELAP